MKPSRNLLSKIALLFLLVSASGLVRAQVTVTLSVDMQQEVISSAGVHVAGNFQGWDPSLTPMTDEDLDGIFTYSFVASDIETVEFVFINGADWGGEEAVPQACVGSAGFGRSVELNTTGENVSYSVCFGQCADCDSVVVHFRVDMSQEPEISPDGVHIAGSFQGWDPSTTMMEDGDGDLVFTHTAYFDQSQIGQLLIYRYFNGNSWDYRENTIGSTCVDSNGNRSVEIGGATTVTGTFDGSPHCFSICESCSEVTPVTFRVDMSSQESISVNGVCVAGSFQGWWPGSTMLSDEDGDLIFETTVGILPGTYEYKFLNGVDWGDSGGNYGTENLLYSDCVPEDSGDNRQLIVGDEAMEVSCCYNSCSESCQDNLAPANITFRVNMENYLPSPAGVYLMGNFTSPAWQPSSAILMTDEDLDLVYEATVLVSGDATVTYRFVNGMPWLSGEAESGLVSIDDESISFESAGCGFLSNPLSEYVRSHTRSGENEVLDVVCWNECVNCSQCEWADDLFISEYVEGTGNNKAIEFYNPTNYPIDLSAYTLQRWSNGSAMVSDLIQLQGVVPALGVHVLVNGQTEDVAIGGGAVSPACNPELQALANQLSNEYPDPLFFNGDDALVLVKDDFIVVDIFGKPGEDPGTAWTDDEANDFLDVGNGAELLSRDHTLRRKPNVLNGVTSPQASFNVLEEYDVYEIDDWSGLGWHASECEPSVFGCLDTSACNYDSLAWLSDDSCVYPGCQDLNANNYDEASGCPGPCEYFDFNCASIGGGEWEEFELGLLPENQQAVHGEYWTGEWVFNLPSTVVEPESGVAYGIHHVNWTGLVGLPEWAEVDYVLGEFGASSQHCITANGTPTAPAVYELEATGEVFISIFGQPFSIGVQSFTAVLEVVANPNPIPGCTYPNATNFLPYADVDDGGCLFSGCMDSQAPNFNPIATVDDGSCGEPCDSGSSTGCASDSNGDGMVNVVDLLQLLSEFEDVCE